MALTAVLICVQINSFLWDCCFHAFSFLGSAVSVLQQRHVLLKGGTRSSTTSALKRLVLLGLSGLLANCSFCCFDKSQQVAECFTSDLAQNHTPSTLSDLSPHPPSEITTATFSCRTSGCVFPTVGDRPWAALLFFFSMSGDLTVSLQMALPFFHVPQMTCSDRLLILRSGANSCFP